MNLHMNVLAIMHDIDVYVCALVRACGLKAINEESESEFESWWSCRSEIWQALSKYLLNFRVIEKV